MAEVRIEHVFKRFGAVTAVNDFDLVVKDGEFVSISVLPVAVKPLPCV
mgnify:CR=1 FL=1